MKILHFIEGRCNPDTANGVDKTIYFLTRELAALGHEVHLISETKKDPIEIPGVSIIGLSRFVIVFPVLLRSEKSWINFNLILVIFIPLMCQEILV